MHNKFDAVCSRFKIQSVSLSIYDCIGKINRARCKTSAIIAGMFIFANTVTFAAPQSAEIKIIDGGAPITVVSGKDTVSHVLAEQGITLGMYDVVNPGLNTYVSDEMVIVIERVKKVILNDGGVTREYFTTKNTVGEFFRDKGIIFGEYDYSDVPNDTPLADTNAVTVNRVVKTIISAEEAVPYNTIEEKNPAIEKGTTFVVKNGENGIAKKTYEVVFENGTEISRTEISSQTLLEPIDKIVCIGTRPKPGEGPENYSKVITCTATAYDLSYESCGKRPGDKGYGITATGTKACYGTVAVDPRVIPLGSKLYIETGDGSFVYGYATAADTGGAIKGNKVDLFFPTRGECMNFGRRSVKVYVLN